MFKVSVLFDGAQHQNYTYVLPEWITREEINIGDRVIVDSPYTGYTAVKIIDISEVKGKMPVGAKFIVTTISSQAYEQQKENAERKAFIEDRLIELIKLESQNETFERLAEKNGEAKELFEELKTL